jgi:hypothetical protein
VLNLHKLPFINESNKVSVCDACQRGKSHQLPYPRSSSVSSSVLDLVFSYVWGPAPISVGRNNYYVSFIDDLVNLHGYISCVVNLKFFNVFAISKHLLNANLIEKSVLYKRIGWGVSSLELLLHAHGHFTPCVVSTCTPTKRFCRAKTHAYCRSWLNSPCSF